MIRKCALCDLNLTNDPKFRVFSYWKINCPGKWHIFICNGCITKNIDTPCTQDEIRKQKIRKGFQIKH